VRGVGADKSALPSVVLGMPRVGSLNHCAHNGRLTSMAAAANPSLSLIIGALGFARPRCYTGIRLLAQSTTEERRERADRARRRDARADCGLAATR
jgi:hypothetical protein